MAIDNYTQAELIDSFTFSDLVANGDGTYTTPVLTLADAFGDAPYGEGGYEDVTTNQDDILVVRKFDHSTIDPTTYNHTTDPLRTEEAWEYWTHPKANSSGSYMYTLGTNNKITFEAADAVISGTETSVWDRTRENPPATLTLPSIADGDLIYVFRKTSILNKSIHFQPASRLTAASLNTALDQLFRLSQENYAFIHNFSKLNPAVGNPNGVCPLNAKGLIDETYVDDTLFLTADNQDGTGTVWDAKGMIISNMADPTNPAHATTKQWVTNTNTLTNYYNKTQTDDFLDDKADLVGGKVPDSQIPAIAISEYLGNVANEAAMNALTAQAGDWCIRTDENRQYVYGGSAWIQLAAPTAAVDSITTVDGGTETGSVTLIASDLSCYTIAQIDAQTYTRTQIEEDIIGPIPALGDTETVMSWAVATFANVDLGNVEVITSGATESRDLDDRFADWVNVKDWGAVGDGATDDTADIQAAITAAAGKRMYFPCGTYKVTSTLNVPSTSLDWDLNGSTIDFDDNGNDALLLIPSGSVDDAVDLTDLPSYDHEEGGIVVAMSDGEALAFSAGTKVRIWSDDAWNSNTTSAGNRYKGELNDIVFNSLVPLPTEPIIVELAVPLRDTYTTSPKIQAIVPTKGLKIRNGTLKNSGVNSISLADNITYSENIQIDQVTFENFRGTATGTFDWCRNVVITNCTFMNRETGTIAPPANHDRIGIKITRCENVLVQGCTFYGVRKPLYSITSEDAWGVSRNIKFLDNTVNSIKTTERYDAAGEDYGEQSYEGIMTSYNTENVFIRNNTVYGSESFTFYSEGGSYECKDNKIYYSSLYDGTGDDLESGALADIIYTQNSNDNEAKVNISGNLIEKSKCSDAAIRIWSGLDVVSNVSGSISVCDNIISDARGGIHVLGAIGKEFHNVSVRGNTIRDVFVGVKMQGCVNSLVSENIISCNRVSPDINRVGIDALDIKDGLFNSNTIKMTDLDSDWSNKAIVLAESTEGSSTRNNITNNILKGNRSVSEPTGANDYAIFASPLTSGALQINGNTVEKFKNHIYTPLAAARRFGNLLYPGAYPGDSAGWGWGKELDTGFVPQGEHYFTPAGSDRNRYRPKQPRFITIPHTAALALHSGGASSVLHEAIADPTTVGLKQGDIIMWAGATAATMYTSEMTDEVKMEHSNIIAVPVNFKPMEGIDITNPLELAIRTVDGSPLNEAVNNGETIFINIILLVAESIDTDGALY